jgi:hypothetical protein
MSLESLFNVFSDERGLAHFSFANADLHNRQNAAIQKKYNRSLPYYILDPFPVGTARINWLQTHAQLHSFTNTLLGIASNDLSDLDFNDPRQVASWVWLHAQEHLQASNKLGVA